AMLSSNALNIFFSISLVYIGQKPESSNGKKREKFIVGIEYMLRYDAYLSNDYHKVQISGPARYNMHVQVLLDSRTGNLTDINADVKPFRMKCLCKAINREPGKFHNIEQVGI